MRTANESSRGTIGLSRHAACIHYHQISAGALYFAVPRRTQPLTDSLAIGARRSTAKVLHVEGGRHNSSLRPSCSRRRFNHTASVILKRSANLRGSSLPHAIILRR